MKSKLKNSYGVQSLEDVYTAWRWSFLGWLIPGLVSLAIGVWVAISAGQNELVGTLIGVIAAGAITAICLGALFIQILSRWRVIKHVYIFNVFHGLAPIAFRIDPKIFGWDRKEVTDFLNELCGPKCKSFIQDLERRYHRAKYPIKLDSFVPVTFVTVKPVGGVIVTFKGVKKRCRGLQHGQWCEVEWREPTSCKALIEHELEHVILTKAYLLWGEKKQHEVMKHVREPSGTKA